MKTDEVLDEALAAFANPQAFTAESNAIVEQIKPLLAGKGAAIQGSVLADLVAIWIGGHIVPGDPAASEALQADMLEIHRQTVTDLIAYYKAKPPGQTIDREDAEPLVVDVPVAGAMAGFSRVRSYAAAKSGDMPTIKIAGRLKVPLKRWKAILNGDADRKTT